MLSPVTVNKNVGAGTFAVAFDPNGTALAAEIGSGGTTSAISSYSVQSNGTILPNLGGGVNVTVQVNGSVLSDPNRLASVVGDAFVTRMKSLGMKLT